jgi:large subunit ribosomal protein L17
MKHRRGFNPLQRMASHRKALHRNMVTSLFKQERIRTTKAKALEVRRTAEKMITRAKEDTVHNRRIVSGRLYNEGIVAKLFTDIAPRMKDRNGGYTRIIKLGERKGDAAEVVILELVDYKLDTGEKKKTKKGEEKSVASSKPAKDSKSASSGKSSSRQSVKDSKGKKGK